MNRIGKTCVWAASLLGAATLLGEAILRATEGVERRIAAAEPHDRPAADAGLPEEARHG